MIRHSLAMATEAADTSMNWPEAIAYLGLIAAFVIIWVVTRD